MNAPLFSPLRPMIPTIEIFADSFMREFRSAPPERRFLLGTNRYAEALAKRYEFGGVIDEFAMATEWNGLRMLSVDDLPQNSLVISTATGRPLKALAKLDRPGVWAIDYFSLRKLAPEGLPPIRFNEDFDLEYARNRHRFEQVSERLADMESKRLFAKLIDFRLNQNLAMIADFRESLETQYFDDCVRMSPDEVFFDIGGFEGETTEAFMARSGRDSRAYVFEPDADNRDKCIANLARFSNVTVMSDALSDSTISHRMDGSGSNARLIPDSEGDASTNTLDAYGSLRPTFIKIDVEGHELNVLGGAAKTIAAQRPKIAVATYHQPDHFWRIPELVLSLNPDYQLYLRHYTESIYESVYYFIPS